MWNFPQRLEYFPADRLGLERNRLRKSRHLRSLATDRLLGELQTANYNPDLGALEVFSMARLAIDASPFLCACWEPQTDGACHAWARAHHGVRRFPFRM